MRLITTLAAAATALSCIACATTAAAEPSFGPVQLNQVRVFDDGANSFALIEVKGQTFCGTNTFKINLASIAGAGMLSASLTAVSTGQTVILEMVNGTNCSVGGYATQLQSIALLS